MSVKGHRTPGCRGAGKPAVTLRVRLDARGYFDGTERFPAEHYFFDFTEPGVA